MLNFLRIFVKKTGISCLTCMLDLSNTNVEIQLVRYDDSFTTSCFGQINTNLWPSGYGKSK